MSTTTGIELIKQKKATTVKAWTGEEFIGREFPPKEPLIEGLLHRRDLVCLAARRRNGKTSILTDLAVSLAVPVKDFIGYIIPEPRRSLLLVLEDDPGEYQEKLRKVIGDRNTEGRIRIITRDDFFEAGLPIDVREEGFREAVRKWAKKHKPDLIVIDNLAHVIDAEYNESKRVHELMKFCYQLAKDSNAAIILAAHPRKDNGEDPVSLRQSPTLFFEAVMGSSHFINSTGSLWGLERPEREEYSVFLGGLQRGNGQQQTCFLTMDDQGRFEPELCTESAFQAPGTMS
jgi:CheY-like chemotaxis protein